MDLVETYLVVETRFAIGTRLRFFAPAELAKALKIADEVGRIITALRGN